MLALLGRVLPRWRPASMAFHAVLVTAAYLLAFLFRFEFSLRVQEWDWLLRTLPVLLFSRVIVFAWFGLYEGVWKYVSMRDILAILKAATVSSLIFSAGVLIFFGHGFPRSILVLDWVMCLALVGGVRLASRAFRESGRKNVQAGARRALIIGAGDAGEALLREFGRNVGLNYEIVGFVDDDPRKKGKRIHGIEVGGGVAQIPQLCHSKQAQEILVAIPSATQAQQLRILRFCRESGLPFKTVPALNELLLGRAAISQLQDFRTEDLLGRQEVRLDLDQIRKELRGRRVLVTGAAGSIGSELCRQLAAFEPEKLVLLDRAESNLYFLSLELRQTYPLLKVYPVVGDILDQPQVEEVLRAYAPDVLYHAAAYKHVPLIEEHPLEGMQNNVFGTEAIAVAARAAKVKKFVFVSTDKAVRPVGIMGMTKRVAEGLLLCLHGETTMFVVVRFGNVLGSEGSVVPLFRWQIASGGPVTLTDPEATRYFMLLSEAAQLVLQAGAMGQGGEVFFLNMGEPVRILDLARNVIRLSGLEPERDIPIEIIGLRPGERLREELVLEQEEFLPSAHENVLVVRNIHFDAAAFRKDLDVLRRLVEARDRERAVEHLKIMATTY